MNLIQRATNISLNPKTEWPVIAVEGMTTAELFKSYIIPLSAIPAAQAVAPCASWLDHERAIATSLPVCSPLFASFVLQPAAASKSCAAQWKMA